jgi:hypothetical protein
VATLRDIVTALAPIIVWGPPPATVAELQRRYAEIILSDDDGDEWGKMERALLANFPSLADAHVTRAMLELFGDELDLKQRETSGLGALMRTWSV